MWVITVFEQKDVRIFEYTNKGEATQALKRFKKQLDRQGVFRELRGRERYEKPSEIRRKRKLAKKNKINGKPKKNRDAYQDFYRP